MAKRRTYFQIESQIYRSLPKGVDEMRAKIAERVAALADDERKAWKILLDLNDRRGYRHLWEEIEEDSKSICNEIFAAIREAVANG